MSTTPAPIQLAFPFSLWDRIKAAFVLIPQRPLNIIIHSVVPVIGIAVFVLALIKGQTDATILLILVACLSMTPLFTVVAVLINYVSVPHAREPFTYAFDDSGIHVHSSRFAFTHKWEAIRRVRRAGGFMFFFFGPGAAHCVPLGAIKSARAEESLLALAQRHGVSTS
jgi:hypothetical protein